MSRNNIALSLFCDGVPIYKSSKTSLWPIYFTVLNLHPSIRHLAKNIIIAGLWVGPKKPPIDELFKPLTEMLDHLSSDGIVITLPTGDSLLFKFKLVMGIFDLPAKAAVMCTKLFNGEYGCQTCEQAGLYISHRRVYPPRPCRERNHQQITLQAKEAVHQHESIKGIKGISPLTNYVDLVDSIPVDYMHAVLEGTVGRLLNLWFNSTHHSKPFYIGRKLSEIDQLLMLQKPPNEFSRSPRSISNYRKFWKASELRQFLLFYSLPILQGKLPSLYWQHYALLVCAMHILLNDNISSVELAAAEIMLTDFYVLFEELYGIIQCSHNVHLLSHLVKYVRLWGPLWTHSAFCFENKNGLIKNLFHGTNDITKQILFNINAECAIQTLIYDIKRYDEEEVVQYIYERSQKSNMLLLYQHVYAVGNIVLLTLNAEEEDLIQHHGNVQGFYRLLKEGIMFHCTNYRQGNDCSKRNNTYCQYKLENGLVHFGQIQQFLLSPKPLALIKEVANSSQTLTEEGGYSDHQTLQKHQRVNYTEKVIKSFILLDTVIPVEIFNIVKKVVLIETETNKYLSALPNQYEYH